MSNILHAITEICSQEVKWTLSFDRIVWDVAVCVANGRVKAKGCIAPPQDGFHVVYLLILSLWTDDIDFFTRLCNFIFPLWGLPVAIVVSLLPILSPRRHSTATRPGTACHRLVYECSEKLRCVGNSMLSLHQSAPSCDDTTLRLRPPRLPPRTSPWG